MTSNSAQVMNEIANVTGSANARIDAHTRKVNEATAAWERFNLATSRAGTMFAGGGALAGIAAMTYGVNVAAKLQLAMQGVYASTGTAKNPMMQKKLFDMVVSTSGMTAQDATTIAKELSMVASSGLNDPTRLMKAFPQIAKAADVLWLSTMGTPKAVDPVEAATQMNKLSHLFGAYYGQPLHNMLDAIVRLQMVQPDALAKVVTQAKYFVPTAIAAGVDMKNLPQSDLITMLASMGQTGLMQGRGGTGLARYIEYFEKAPTLTAHLSKIQRASMIDLGLFDSSGRNKFLDSSGNFELGASMHYLGQKYDEMIKSGHRAQFLADLYGAFLQQGGQFASTMLLPQVRAQRQQNILGMQRIAPPGSAVEALWYQYMHTTVGAWQYFTTNFKNIWIYTFTPMLPDVTAALRGMGYEFGRFGNTLKDNPEMAADLAHIVEGITAFAAARAALGGALWLVELAAGIKGLGPGLTGATKAFRILDSFLLAGVGKRVLGLAMDIAKLEIARDAAGNVTDVALALKALSIAGGSFMLSPLGRLVTGALGMSKTIAGVTGGVGGRLGPIAAFAGEGLSALFISLEVERYGKLWAADWQKVANKLGPPYANMIFSGGYELDLNKPFQFGPGLKGQVPLSAQDFYIMHPDSLHKLDKAQLETIFKNGWRDALRENPVEVKISITDRTSAGIRSAVSSRGNIQTSRYAPHVLQTDLAHPPIGEN
jgi:hypothetical protein